MYALSATTAKTTKTPHSYLMGGSRVCEWDKGCKRRKEDRRYDVESAKRIRRMMDDMVGRVVRLARKQLGNFFFFLLLAWAYVSVAFSMKKKLCILHSVEITQSVVHPI